MATTSFSVTFRYVSSSPAQDAVLESSAVAEERTATNLVSRVLKCLMISVPNAFGMGASAIKSRIIFEYLSTVFKFLWLTFFSRELISIFNSVSCKNRSKADAKTTNPGGTGILAFVISPSEEPFPPASATLFLLSCLNDLIYIYISSEGGNFLGQHLRL